MENGNWMPPTQGQPQSELSPADGGDWRTQLQPDSRQRIVNKIMDTLKKHLPFSGQEGLNELKKIAVRFEEKIYSAALNQPDYLRKISLKMLSLETKSQNTISSTGLLNPAANNKYPPDPASQSMQSQIHGAVQSLPPSIANSQSQTRQSLLPSNIQNNVISSGLQSSGGLTATLPPSNLAQNQLPTYTGHNGNMPNIAGMPQNGAGSGGVQGVVSSTFGNAQRPMQSRQLGQTVSQQQLYQQQFQQQILKQKLHQGNISNSLMQSNLQQQQMHQQQMQPQQNMLHQSHLQSAQQSISQASSSMTSQSMQAAQFSGALQQNQQQSLHQITPSVLQQQSQQSSAQQQASIIHQQQTSTAQQTIQQRPHQLISMDHQSNPTNIQHQLLGQQNSVHDMQQQQQRLLGQQNSISNIQQTQQSLMSQQNQLSNLQQQFVVPSGTAGVQSNQHGNMMNPSKLPAQQQSQQSVSALMASQGQQQQLQQQLVTHIAPQSSQLQQIGLPRQPNMLQRDAPQRHNQSGSLLQPQNYLEHQRQLFQAQKASPDALSSSLECTAESGQVSGGDWQEETYQRIKALKDMYFSELTEINQRVSAKLQMQDVISHQGKNHSVERLRVYKGMLDHLLTFLQSQKSSVTHAVKEKMMMYEKQVNTFIAMSKPRRLMPGQQLPSHLNPAAVAVMQTQQQQQQQGGDVQGSLVQIQNSISSLNMINSNNSSNSSASMQQQMNIANVIPPPTKPQQQHINMMHQPNSSSTVFQQHHQKQQQLDILQAQQLKQQQQQQRHLLMQRQHHTNDPADLKMRQQQGPALKPGTAAVQHPIQRSASKPVGGSFPMSSPPLPQHSSPQVDVPGRSAMTPSQPSIPAASPSTPLAPSPVPAESDKAASIFSSHVHAGNATHPHPPAIGTPGMSASPFLSDLASPQATAVPSHARPTAAEQPLDRLLRAVKSLTPVALDSTVRDIRSVTTMMDMMAGSAPGNGSRAAVGDDLAAMTKCRLQARTDGASAPKKMKRNTSAFPLNDVVSPSSTVDDSLRHVTLLEASELESSHSARGKSQSHEALMEEIRGINCRLIDTVVEMSAGDGGITDVECEGKTVTCAYTGVALSSTLKQLFSEWIQVDVIRPLRVLVPTNYPGSSPVPLDVPFEVRETSSEDDICGRVRSRFSAMLRGLPQPMSLWDIARAWDTGTRQCINEYAERSGGGTFASCYGEWEDCLSTA